MTLSPALLAPVFVPRIWGARSLAPLFDAPPGAEPIGEVWLTGESCAFASGPFAGQMLGQAWPALSAEWTGTRLRGQPRIPLLVKFLFPEDNLSLQVHPGDEYARRHESASGGVGKTEMWHAVTAREGAEVRLGFLPGVTPEAFDRGVTDGTADQCLRRFPVRAGDTFFVPAGTVHTIGPGMVLCEIQQYSDITYRIFDYGRLQPDGTPRPLHMRQAREVMRFGSQDGGKIEPLPARRGPLAETFLVACRYFAAERLEFFETAAAATSPGQFELLIILAGRGRLEWGSQSAEYGPAQVWFLPAALGAYRLAPSPQSPATLLRTYVPDREEYAQHLAARQVEPSALARVWHS